MPKEVYHPTLYRANAKMEKFRLNIIDVLFDHLILKEQRAITFLSLSKSY